MFPTWEVELDRSTYNSSRWPSSTRAIRHSSPSETLISISFGTSVSPLSFVLRPLSLDGLSQHRLFLRRRSLGAFAQCEARRVAKRITKDKGQMTKDARTGLLSKRPQD